jgi:hypothetical protein
MHDLRIVRVKQNNNIALMDKICNPSIDMQLAVVVFFLSFLHHVRTPSLNLLFDQKWGLTPDAGVWGDLVLAFPFYLFF